MRFKIFYCSILFFMFGVIVNAQNLPKDYPTSLYEYAELADLEDRNLSLPDFRSIENEIEFHPLSSANSNLGFTNHHFWLKFSLNNPAHTAKTIFLETGRPITEQIILYQIDSDGIEKKFISGELISMDKRPFQHRKIIFPLELEGHSNYSFYIHYKSDGEVINLPLNLYDTNALINQTFLEQLFFGLFYGVLLVTSITYMFFYFRIKLPSFLWYSIYVISIGLFHFSLDGHFNYFLAPEINWFSQNKIIFFGLASAFSAVRYVQVFIGLKTFNPNLNWIIDRFLIGILILFTLRLISQNAIPYFHQIANVFIIVVIILCIYGLIRSYIKQQQIDQFFTLGICTLAIGFLIFIINGFSIIENSFWIENITKFSTGLEIIFLSFAMTNKIKFWLSEKERMQELALSQARESNEIKSFFLSNINHELRTPLNAIIGLSQAILQENKNSYVNKDLEIIQIASIGLLNSIDDILDYSKIEKNELKLEYKSVNLPELIQQIIHHFEIQAQNKNLEFIYEEINPLPIIVIGDQHRLKQMLTNVLNNAIKFTSEGYVKLSVKSADKDKHTINFLFSVEDTGVGISEWKNERIFKSFIQEQADDNRKFGGFGLGLYIVKTIIDLYEGKLKIVSEVNRGTKVNLSLDLKKPVYNCKRDKATQLHSKRSFEERQKSFLIVEDNSVNQLVMKSILKKWPKTTFEIANNGNEALDRMKERKFDLIYMDLQMPEMDGYEAAIVIRKNNIGQNDMTIPIIAVTADATEKAKSKVFEVGMNAYLTKPIDSDNLKKATLDLI